MKKPNGIEKNNHSYSSIWHRLATSISQVFDRLTGWCVLEMTKTFIDRVTARVGEAVVGQVAVVDLHSHLMFIISVA